MTGFYGAILHIGGGFQLRRHGVLAAACAAHFVHDGFADVVYVLLPVWSGEFALSYSEVGALRTTYAAAMATSQFPAGFLSERWSERWLLVVGTAVTGVAFISTGPATGFPYLLAALAVAGLGSGLQHSLSSSLVSGAYDGRSRRAALATYNFSGDLGKAAVPALLALAALAIGWRSASAGLGALGVATAAALLAVLGGPLSTTSHQNETATADDGTGWGVADWRSFRALTAVGFIDATTRTAFLTFLPFALVAKGLGVAGMGGALALVFAGGACGKFLCGILAARLGVVRTVIVTEAMTAIGIVAVVVAPLSTALILLAPLGIALNGTSSVLYATVADLVLPVRRARAYALYYTVLLTGSGLAPLVYGAVSDRVGVDATLVTIGTLVLLTIPLCLTLSATMPQSPS
jgi:MFS family permease